MLSLAQEVGPETNTTLLSNQVFEEGGDSQTATTERIETPTDDHNVLQLDPVM